jgi:hypothetical protein
LRRRIQSRHTVLAIAIIAVAVLAFTNEPASGADPVLENRVRVLEQSIRALTLGAPPVARSDAAATRCKLDDLTAEVRRLRAYMDVLRQLLDANERWHIGVIAGRSITMYTGAQAYKEAALDIVAQAAAIISAQKGLAQTEFAVATLKQKVKVDQAVVDLLTQSTDQLKQSNRILDITA